MSSYRRVKEKMHRNTLIFQTCGLNLLQVAMLTQRCHTTPGHVTRLMKAPFPPPSHLNIPETNAEMGSHRNATAANSVDMIGSRVSCDSPMFLFQQKSVVTSVYDLF